MKHLTLIILTLFILLPRPVYAQDATQEAVIVATEDPSGTIVEDGGTVINIEAPETPVEASTPLLEQLSAYAWPALLGLIVIVAGVFGKQIIALIAPLVSPETAKSLYESGIQLGIQIGLDRSAATPSEIDDDFFLKQAELRGLEAIKTPEGGYILRKKPIMPIDPSRDAGTLHISGADIAKNGMLRFTDPSGKPIDPANITNIHPAGGESIGGDAEFR